VKGGFVIRRHCRRQLLVLFLLPGILLAVTPLAAQADSFYWQGAGTGGNTAIDPSDPTTLWLTPGNWTSGAAPGSADTAYLILTNSGYVNTQTTSVGTLYLDGTSAQGALHLLGGITFTTTSLRLGYTSGSIGSAVQADGDNVTRFLYMGYNSSSTGCYTLSEGSLTVGTTAMSGVEYVGRSGTGVFVQNGGTHTVCNFLYLGYNTGSTGTYILGGGTLCQLLAYGSGVESIGGNGKGYFTQTGGVNLALGGLSVGGNGSYYRLGDGSLIVGTTASPSSEYIGSSGNATFTQTGGSHLINGVLYAGYNASTTGTFVLGSGTLTIGAPGFPGAEYIGYNGTGTFTQTGGTHTIYGDLLLSFNTGSKGNFTQTNGAVNVAGNLMLGSSGAYRLYGGTLNVTGTVSGTGAFICEGGALTATAVTAPYYIGYDAGTNITVSPDSLPTLQTLYLGYSGQASLTQSAGTCVVTSSLYAGYNASGSGSYTLGGGTLTVGKPGGSGVEYIGYSGKGTFTQTGGTHTVYGKLYVQGLNSTYTLDEGSLNTTGTEYISRSFTQNGGTHSVVGNLSLGTSGCYRLYGGSLNVTGSIYGNGMFVPDGGTFTAGTISATVCYGYDAPTCVSPSFDGSPTFKNLYLGYDGQADASQSVGICTVTSELDFAYNAGSSGSYTLGGGTLVIGVSGSSGSENIGYRGTGTFTQTGGTHTVDSSIYLGFLEGSHGSYSFVEGTLNVGSSGHNGGEIIGYNGIGVFSQTGGTHTIFGSLYVGYLSGSSGTYTLEGGALEVTGAEYVGYNTTRSGLFTQSGGSHTLNGSLYLGKMSGGRGAYSLSGGTLTVTGSEYLGYDTNAPTTAFAQTGGSQTVQGDILLYPNSTYRLSGGSLNVTGTVTNKFSGGLFIYDGGTLSATAFTAALGVGYDAGAINAITFNGSLDVSNLRCFYVGYAGTGSIIQMAGDCHFNYESYLGYQAGGTGTYQLNGGTLRAGNYEYFGYSGTGCFIQSGGTHLVSSHLYLGYNATGTGSYTMSGGLLTIGTGGLLGNLYVGYHGKGVFSQSGGTHTSGEVSIGGELEGGIGSYFLQGGTLNAQDLRIHLGAVTQTGGVCTLSPYGLLCAGRWRGPATYTLAGGALNVGSPGDTIDEGIGDSGAFLQTGGTHYVSGSLSVDGDDYMAAFVLGGGGLTVGTTGGSNIEYIGRYGSGTFTQTGGTHLINGTLDMAHYSMTSASFTLTGGTLAVGSSGGAGHEYIGGSGTATFVQSGGTHTVYGDLSLSSQASYVLSEGTLTVGPSVGSPCETFSGNASHAATFTQSGGTHFVMGNMNLGRWSSYHMYGGLLNVTGTIGGAGTFTYEVGWMNADTIASGFTIVAGATLTQTGGGAMTICGPQSHGAGSAIVVEDGRLNLNSNAGTLGYLTSGGPVSSVATTRLTLNNSSTASFGSSQALDGLTLNGAAMGVLAAGGNTIYTKGLSLTTSTARLDLTDGNLIVDYDGASPLAAITALVKSGAGTIDGAGKPQWNGAGVTSSSAQATHLLTALGIRDTGFTDHYGSQPALTSVDGVPVDGTSVVVKYTYVGDANLDGTVDINDYNVWQYFLLNPPEGAGLTWMTGDFNYDGHIDVNDYNAWQYGLLNQSGPLGGAALEPVVLPPTRLPDGQVPEPATLMLLAAGSLLAAMRRKPRG
jgi:fibronectin-binding autotransporter adhesin